MSDGNELNNQVLKKIRSILKEKMPYAKVGILGDTNSRSEGNSNATIGAKHEFGETVKINGTLVKLPERSFLRMPLMTRLNVLLKSQKNISEDTLKKIIEEKSFSSLIAKLGILGESVVKEAFETGGFGKWKPSNDPMIAKRPQINQLCTDCYWEDGKLRTPCNLKLRFGDEQATVVISDDENRCSIVTTAGTVEEALDLLEDALVGNKVRWKPWGDFGASKKGKRG